MKTKQRNHLKLGLFVAAGLALFVLAIYFLGKMQNLFQTNISVRTEFTDVKGLQTGNGVHYMGIKVGTVQNISIMSDSTVLVEMGIDKDIGPFIGQDARVEIDNEGLMGSKIIVIHPGTEGAEGIKEKDQLSSFTSISYEDILNELENTTTLTSSAARNLLEVTEKINSGSGDMANMINDDVLSRNMGAIGSDLLEITSKTKELLTKASEGDNDMATLLNQNTLTSKMLNSLENIDSTSENLKAASIELLMAAEEMKAGNGAIQKLIYDSTFSMEIDTVVHGINSGIVSVVETAEAIKGSWIINLFSGKDKSKDKKQ